MKTLDYLASHTMSILSHNPLINEYSLKQSVQYRKYARNYYYINQMFDDLLERKPKIHTSLLNLLTNVKLFSFDRISSC